MPELPEVEHVATALQRVVAGRAIEIAELRRERLAPDCTPGLFTEQLSGATINFVHRRGKHILLDLDNGRTLIVHLRMSGRFHHLSADDTDPKFAHAVFHFVDQKRLVFQDQRHFGLMKIVDTKDLFNSKELAKLAPEPFSEEFSIEYLREKLRSSGRTVKEFLLDQTKVCGVGNIYASESLYLSGISPRRKGRNVPKSKTLLLHQYIRVVLEEAIAMTKTILPDANVLGEGVYGEGSIMRWRVYDREGQPCARCAAPIKRIRQGARSTYFCPMCQR